MEEGEEAFRFGEEAKKVEELKTKPSVSVEATYFLLYLLNLALNLPLFLRSQEFPPRARSSRTHPELIGV